MTVFWGFVLGLPLLAFGAGALFSSDRTSRFVDWFESSRGVAIVLSAIAWFWTAYECDTIGIDVFDMILKRFPGQLWIMAAVLTYLVVIWMPRCLPVRALTGILMLIPAELFKATRLLVPASGFAPVHVFVVTGYIGAVIGMYGMFYPWRLEKGLAWFFAGRPESAPYRSEANPGRPVVAPYRTKVLGAVLTVWGAALILIGFFL